jgi:CBS domain-containing protein
MLSWLISGEFSPYEPLASDSFRHITSVEYQQAERAADVMSSPVLTVQASDSLADAYERMRGYGISHLVVVDQGQFSGLLSDRDVLMSHDRRARVDSEMSTELLLSSPDETIHSIAGIMVRHRINCVPLLDQEYHLVGILTTTDILGCLTYQAPRELWAY